MAASNAVAAPALLGERGAQLIERLRIDRHAQLSVLRLLDSAASQLRQGLQDVERIWKAAAQFAQHGARADALAHPAAQHRACGLPDIELGIQLAAQTLDVQQRLLQ